MEQTPCRLDPLWCRGSDQRSRAPTPVVAEPLRPTINMRSASKTQKRSAGWHSKKTFRKTRLNFPVARCDAGNSANHGQQLQRGVWTQCRRSRGRRHSARKYGNPRTAYGSIRITDLKRPQFFP